MKVVEADIIVLGAGLVGLAAAISFARQNKKIILVDANKPVITKQAVWDERVFALTPGTISWLKMIGVWQHMDLNRVKAICAMRLWAGAGNDPLVLSDSDANLPKLGMIVENQNLLHALWQQINVLDVTVITDANCEFLSNIGQHIQVGLKNNAKIVSKLLVAADGVNSWVRNQTNIAYKQKDFHQTAIVANFLAEKNHQDIARQWFAPHETLALLPLPEKYVSMVWSMSTEKGDALLRLSREELSERVEIQCKPELGSLKQVGKTLSFSLNQKIAIQLIADRVALVGDAAHQIHPMAGQGVNLGFRDVIELQNLFSTMHSLQDIGDKTFLRKYERSRRADIATMSTLTSGLDSLFATDISLMKKWTDWGLTQLNRNAIIKKWFIQQAVS